MSERQRVLCVDFDNTITQGNVQYWSGEMPKPDHETVEAVRQAYYEGWSIIVWTARPWDQAGQIATHLLDWNVPYHGIRCNKGSGTTYVDDKMMSIADFKNEF